MRRISLVSNSGLLVFAETMPTVVFLPSEISTIWPILSGTDEE